MSLSQDQIDALLSLPALEPPPGISPNFDDPPNRNGLAYFVTTFCLVVSTLCVFIRLYARVWIEKRARIEEVLMICAYGSYWGTVWAGYEMIKTPGYYVHTWNLHNGDLVRPLWLILVYGCAYSFVLPFIKTAILLDWCRLFVPADNRRSLFWWACMALGGFQCLWGLLCTILLNVQCVPHRAIWEFWVPAKCFNLPKVMLASASCQVATDFIMMLLPQGIIWTLQLNWQKRLGVSIIFGVGVLACVAACFRLDQTITFAKETDLMYFIGPLLFWADAEMTCGFFIFCIPCLPKLIKESSLSATVKSMLGLSSNKSRSYATGGGHTGTGTGTGVLSKYGKGFDDGRDLELGTSGKRSEEGSLPLSDMERSESQERLHGHGKGSGSGSGLGGGVHVTKTTMVTITHDSRSNGSTTDFDTFGESGSKQQMTPWTVGK
ncbi:hypothetical protein QBC45DRAFT_447946 [Copromyces sp. CBS 386.78]|nr:hypothetical protein QBC45DRAFT_447946 [Copromyces sp. CBS 386.78]